MLKSAIYLVILKDLFSNFYLYVGTLAKIGLSKTSYYRNQAKQLKHIYHGLFNKELVIEKKQHRKPSLLSEVDVIKQPFYNETRPTLFQNTQSENDYSPKGGTDINDIYLNVSSHNNNYYSARQACVEAALLTNIPRTAVNVWLTKLKPFLPEIPKDYRTLLRTAKRVEVIELANGKIIKYNLKLQLLKVLNRKKMKNVTLDFHVDEFKLAKSNTKGLWTILCRIRETNDVKLVHMFEGTGKPDRKMFFEDVFLSLRSIIDGGIELDDGFIICVRLGVIAADVPARAYILNILTMGNNGCHLCHVIGQKIDTHKPRSKNFFNPVKRMHYEGVNHKQRTDKEYRLKTYYHNIKSRSHHLSTETTEIEYLKHVDIPRLLIVDYMHCSLLGVMKYYLELWKVIFRSFSEKLEKNLIYARTRIPSDFQRHCQGNPEQWKATEFRLFLLYIGPIVLKDILPNVMYTHFLKLSVSIRILCNENWLKFIDIADRLLKEFVCSHVILYPSEPITFNLHLTTHLAECCQYHQATLDTISAFWGENQLQEFRSYYERGQDPIVQIAKRHSEFDNNTTILDQLEVKKPKFEHDLGNSLFGKVKCKNFWINILDGRSEFVESKGKIYKVIKIIKQQNKAIFIAKDMIAEKNAENFFREPLHSCQIGIFKIQKFREKSSKLYKLKEEEINCKYLTFNSEFGKIFVRILHCK